MDLNTIETVVRPTTRLALPMHRPGDAFLGGGTWLFSEPQPHLRRLVDLPALAWPAISITPDHVAIAATCTLAELDAWVWPDQWRAAPLVSSCCRALLGSFKVWNTATVGGNICLALPAAPMVALVVALEGVCVIWAADGGLRHVAAKEFVIGDRRTVLAPGEILREILLPIHAWQRACVFRQVSLTALGRSAALLIGCRDDYSFRLTITASTLHPVQLRFASVPSAGDLAGRIDSAVHVWHDDIHGAPDWRRHVTHLAAQAIRQDWVS